MQPLNPRSFKSIRKAVAEGRVSSRGDLARQIVDAFRKPINDKKYGVNEQEVLEESEQELTS